MSSRLFAIGDVHGCLAALDAILDAIRPGADDLVVPLGDYVDRGPDSRGVIERLIELEDHCRLAPILGNHEEMMLNALRGQEPDSSWLWHGGAATVMSYGGVDLIPEEHVAWIENCLDYHEEDDWFFTHANYVATEKLNSQPAEALRWQSLAEHYPGPHVTGKRAVLGHSAQRSGKVYDGGHFLCIDTYCHGGGWLTAFEPATGEFWQASADGHLRER